MTRAVVAVLLMVVLLQAAPSYATVTPNSLFSDNAILQQGMSVPIWGTAGDGEKVTVFFQDQKVSTVARNGKWMVRLKPLKSGGPFEMTISGENTVELKNILVGEVWLCSGQSNMWWPIDYSGDKQQAKAEPRDPLLRVFAVPELSSGAPVGEADSIWQESDPDVVGKFSAVAYFFGRDLRKALKVPIGLITSAVGGTWVKQWTRRAVVESCPEWFVKYTIDEKTGGLYNGMIAPLIPYAIKGVIWYQGETEALWASSFEYETLFPMLIRNWREDWNQGNFPFLFVQLAPFKRITRGLNPEHKEFNWAKLRETQLVTSLRVPRTAMVVITDFGDEYYIHPHHKAPVGARLALAARALAYEERITYSGPVYKSIKIKVDRAMIGFRHVGSGLMAKGGELTGFTIAGEDRKFVKAKADIHGEKVVVWSPEVPDPVAVRYGWANYPKVNLFNKEGLPASPFRTDEFPVFTEVR
ncbi:MAG: sialate O-acetylesterase [Armatimonadetes bacterium]|nr:sialate O-acetylesterase [Armatimonadota bacterium]